MAVASAGTPAALYRFYAPRPQAASLSRGTELQLLDTLGGDDSALAFDAICELIRRGDACLPVLQGALTRKPLSPPVVAN